MELERLTEPVTLGEGPCWHADEQVLYWVDIFGKALHRFDPSTATDQHWDLGAFVGTVAPRASGGLVVALEDGFGHFEPETGTYEAWDAVEANPSTRFNDGKCDPSGRFWCGSMDKSEEENLGTLYRMGPDRSVQSMVSPVGISNGLGWSPDETKMYYIDSPTRQIWVFDYDASTGAIENRRTLVELTEGEGWPDGMTVDADGNLWLAQWAGSCVTQRDPENGKVMQRIETPAPHTSACCFGGPELTDLYITSARKGFTESQLQEYPDSGCLFRIRLSTQGRPTFAYAG